MFYHFPDKREISAKRLSRSPTAIHSDRNGCRQRWSGGYLKIPLPGIGKSASRRWKTDSSYDHVRISSRGRGLPVMMIDSEEDFIALSTSLKIRCNSIASLAIRSRFGVSRAISANSSRRSPSVSA